jgi:hypothetical protein
MTAAAYSPSPRLQLIKGQPPSRLAIEKTLDTATRMAEEHVHQNTSWTVVSNHSFLIGIAGKPTSKIGN